MIIKPQPGPQEAFLSCSADVAFYGGAAGGGKTMALLLEPLHYVTKVKGFTGVLFRRTYPEITNPGGLWDESAALYPHTKSIPARSGMSWTWPATGSWLKFSHMQYDGDVQAWQGSQIAMIGFDELTHFSAAQFFYMLSRNRSGCGVRPYVRATMNPDPDSWVREFIAWYLTKNGDPIQERSGVIRYFARNKGTIEWADRPGDLTILGLRPKSFTFIAANVHDNKILLDLNPDYLSNLEALLPHERARLLNGNWNARAVAGSFFKRSMFTIVDRAPRDYDAEIRYWDRAASEESDKNPDPDFTAGVHMLVKDGVYYINDVQHFRAGPGEVLNSIRAMASQQPRCPIALEQDPGQSGKAEMHYLISKLTGRDVYAVPATKAKEVRAKPFASQCLAGNVRIVRAPWNEEFLCELEAFPSKGVHDDQVDASSGAFNELCQHDGDVTMRGF